MGVTVISSHDEFLKIVRFLSALSMLALLDVHVQMFTTFLYRLTREPQS